MRRHVARFNGKKLIIASVAILGLFFAVNIYSRFQASESDVRICKKVDHLTNALITFVVESPVPRDPEMRLQQVRFVAAMRGAFCDPNNLPTTKGKP